MILLKGVNVLPEHEDSLFQLLKQYFDMGWQLVASNVTAGTKSGRLDHDDVISRYFLTKEE